MDGPGQLSQSTRLDRVFSLFEVYYCAPGNSGLAREQLIRELLRNLSSHTRMAIVERFGAEAGDWLWNRFTVHYTPKHGSWLNQAEIAIGLFSRQCLGQRRIGDRTSLRKETRAWNTRGISTREFR